MVILIALFLIFICLPLGIVIGVIKEINANSKTSRLRREHKAYLAMVLKHVGDIPGTPQLTSELPKMRTSELPPMSAQTYRMYGAQ